MIVVVGVAASASEPELSSSMLQNKFHSRLKLGGRRNADGTSVFFSMNEVK
jgi:hypothetical protein